MSAASGWHLIADLACTRGLADVAAVEAALRAAAEAAHVHLLEVRLHHFGPEQGVTGVALLAESHISIHTWPEEALAAIDIFVCGPAADPEAALAVLCAAFEAEVVHRALLARLAARGA